MERSQGLPAEPDRDRALLASIIDSSDDAIVSKDLQGVITSWNSGAQRLFGYTADEAIGRSVTMLIPEDRIDEEPGILERIRRGDRVRHYQTIRRRKDGTLVDISLTVSPVIDERGTIIGASKIARDISEHVATQARLRESEERYRRLAEVMPVGVYTCAAPSGSITYYNQHAARIWGRAPEPGVTDERFCGSLRLFLPDGTYLPHAECPMAVALREGRAFRNEEVLIERPDGTRLTVLVNIDPIHDERGAVVAAINTFTDISELKAAQSSLRRERDNLETLLETVPVALFLAHDSDCRRISGNRAAAELLRMEPRENLSLTAPRGHGPTHFSTFRDGARVAPEDLPIQRAARLGEVIRGEELDMHFEDGSKVHELVSAHPLFDEQGRPRGAVACILDVTELKKSEVALLEADRRKDEFLATLSHELRNPLAPILAGLEIMKMAEADAGLVERTRGTMERQAQQLVALVDDLLDVSRITRGKFELRRRRVELQEIVRSALETATPQIEAGGYDLEVELPDEPVVLDADPHRMAQVLANLLHNAVKYTPAGGRIVLRAVQRGGEVAISVMDTGAGIPPEMLQRIFEMFAQVGRPQERGQPGLGIGLTLARSLVEMHQGSIEARSGGPGKGSTFTVRLPVAMSAEAGVHRRASDDTAAPVAGAGRRVLVVDDNEALVDTLSALVALLGNEVRTAPDGRMALEIAAEFRPHVVLMDIGMPGMNGYQAAKLLRAQPWGEHITLVALTGWGQDEDKRRTREAGFDAHLVKPARQADLARVLEGVPFEA